MISKLCNKTFCTIRDTSRCLYPGTRTGNPSKYRVSTRLDVGARPLRHPGTRCPCDRRSVVHRGTTSTTSATSSPLDISASAQDATVPLFCSNGARVLCATAAQYHESLMIRPLAIPGPSSLLNAAIASRSFPCAVTKYPQPMTTDRGAADSLELAPLPRWLLARVVDDRNPMSPFGRPITIDLP